MGYLQRRLRFLLDDISQGNLKVSPDVARHLEPLLDQLSFDEHGDPVVQTASEELRAFARAYYLARNVPASAADPPSATKQEVIAARATRDTTRELFEHFEECFAAFAGTTPERFAARPEDFGAAVRQRGHALLKDPSAANRFEDARAGLAAFYQRSGTTLLEAGSELVGLKLVVGGKQSFSDASLGAVRSMALYADTILIPDSVSRWFERERSAEAFPVPRMAEDLYYLLRLKPLVDADLPYPAILPFPSLEGVLAESDPVTQDGIELLALGFFSHYLGCRFGDLLEVQAWTLAHPDKFRAAVERHRLLVPMEGSGREPFGELVNQVRRSYQMWRTEEFNSLVAGSPDELVAFGAIMERLEPQFHMADNASSLRATPLMSLPVHWHYAELVHRARLIDSGTMDSEGRTIDGRDIVPALSDARHGWLGNVPIEALVRLRQNGENETFRKKLLANVHELAAADPSTLTTTVPAVGRALEALLREHEREVKAIAAKYEKIYAAGAAGAWLTLGAVFAPWLAAGPPPAALGLATTYLGAKATQLLENRRQGQTLTGILAAAARKG